MAADVVAAGIAASVAKKTRHRAQGADFQPITEHVLGLLATATAALAASSLSIGIFCMAAHSPLRGCPLGFIRLGTLFEHD